MKQSAWKMMKHLCKRILPTRFWGILSHMKLQRHIVRYEPRYVHHTYGGVPLNLSLADGLSEDWYDRDWPELREINFLRHHKLKRRARVFNLGAHQCVLALMLAKEVGPEGLVVAVEANAHNAAVGQKNRNLNQAEQLHVLHAAVAERSGKVLFSGGLNGRLVSGVDESGQVEVQAYSIDDLAQKYGLPDVLFIDVEGSECQILQGACRTLNHRPDWFIEVHVEAGLEHAGGSVKQLLSFFSRRDYELFVAPPNSALALASGIKPEFKQFTPEDSVMKSRFYLIAAGRERASGTLAQESGIGFDPPY